MSIQITVRLSDESAAFIDQMVSSGVSKSRAAALDKMVLREKRHQQAQRDALIYATQGEDPEMTAWNQASVASRHEHGWGSDA